MSNRYLNKNGYLSTFSLILLFIVSVIAIYINNPPLNTHKTTSTYLKHSYEHYLMLTSLERVEAFFMHNIDFNGENVLFEDIKHTVFFEEIRCEKDFCVLGPAKITPGKTMQYDIDSITDIFITISPVANNCSTSIYYIENENEILIGTYFADTEQTIVIYEDDENFHCGTYKIVQDSKPAQITVEYTRIIEREINITASLTEKHPDENVKSIMLTIHVQNNYPYYHQVTWKPATPLS